MSNVAISVRAVSKQYTRGQDGGWSVHGGFGALRRLLRGGAGRGATGGHDAFWALDDVSFEVRRGERVGIVGRNGAGKSTLLKVLSRVVYPTSGEATIRGRLTSLLEVGTGFNENLTGRENVYLNASIHGLTRAEIEDRFDDIVDFADVRPFLDTPVKRYSSGMQMRLAFAVAAHLDPDILLLDEVLAVGDLSFQQKCLERVQGLVSEGRTLLFVSHSLDAITRFCDRCIWLDGGKIRRDGPAEQVVEEYLEELAGIRPVRTWAPALTPQPPLPQAGEGEQEPPLHRDGEGPGGGASPDMPGDDDARLVAVRVLGPDRRPVSSMAVDQPFAVEVTFDVLRAGLNVQPALYFKTATDHYLFVAAYTDPEWMRVPPPVGRHTTTAWIPEHLMNVGIVYVTVALATPDPFAVHCTAERAVSFNVFERFGADATARGLYSREFPGSVRPRLQWETQRTGPPEPRETIGVAGAPASTTGPATPDRP